MNSAAFSTDGTAVNKASRDDTAKIWSSTTGDCLLTHAGHVKVNSAAFSSDGSPVVTALYEDVANEDERDPNWLQIQVSTLLNLQSNDGVRIMGLRMSTAQAVSFAAVQTTLVMYTSTVLAK